MSIVGSRHVLLVRRIAVRMSSTNSSYEDAIHKLNSLQSNKSTIDQIKKNIKGGQKCTNIEDMENYLQRIGIPLSKLDELSVIHVAGTKGKGTTSAMCESILRRHGYRTGFYSSPHLVAARERVRIAGRALSEDAFAAHLHRVYGLLDSSQRFAGDMPKYFAFLTALAFDVFLRERVDVAVVEVGIGGVVDYTNVLRKAPVVGITALGLDHTSILGNTLTEIAAAKAGIMKRGCDAYTVQQPEEAMDVLKAYADQVKCTLTVVPDYKSYAFLDCQQSELPVDLDAYRTNASLAIQLSHAWMRAKQAKAYQNGFTNPLKMVQNDIAKSKANDCPNGPKNNGQSNQNGSANNSQSSQNGSTNNQLNQNGSKYDLSSQNTLQNGCDNHNLQINNSILGNLVMEVPYQTAEGLRQCKWPGRYHIVDGCNGVYYLDGAHTKESMEICAEWFRRESSNRHEPSFLIFSATGDRDAEALLLPLRHICFKEVYFVIPTAHKVISKNHDNFSMVEQEELLQRCRSHAKIWKKLRVNSNVTVLECVDDALTSINKHGRSSVLITGSLHLVGAALSILGHNVD